MDQNIAALNPQTSQLVVASGVISGSPTPGVFTPSVGAAHTAPVWSKFSWTNAQVAALAGKAAALAFFTLPKRTVVTRMILVIKTVAAGTSDLTVAVGLDGGAADGFMAAESCQAAAQWGLDPSDMGTLLTNKFALPSMTADSLVDLKFTTTDVAKNLADVTNCTGDLYVETVVLP